VTIVSLALDVRKPRYTTDSFLRQRTSVGVTVTDVTVTSQWHPWKWPTWKHSC